MRLHFVGIVVYSISKAKVGKFCVTSNIVDTLLIHTKNTLFEKFADHLRLVMLIIDIDLGVVSGDVASDSRC